MPAAAIRLGLREIEALAGLPFVSVTLYVLALRPRMNYSDGWVGKNPRLSWQTISEWCRQESRQGVPEIKLDRWALDRAVGHLERAGLVRRPPIKSQRDPIVFFLPFAERDSLVRKNPAPTPAQNPAPVAHRENTPNPAHRPARNPAHHPEDRIPIVTAAAALDVSSAAADLIAPQNLSPTTQANCIKKVQHLNGSAQRILDELAGALADHARQGNPIKFPVRYLDRIIEEASTSTWSPAYADSIAKRRLSEGTRPSNDRGEKEQSTECKWPFQGSEPPPMNRQVAREALKKIKEQIK